MVTQDIQPFQKQDTEKPKYKAAGSHQNKKQFQNQPSDAISEARLLSKGKPRIMERLQDTETIVMNMVHTLVLVSGPSGEEGKVLP